MTHHNCFRRPLDELTRTISDHCLRHRSVLMYTLIGSKDGEKKWMKRDEELDKRCEEVQLYLRFAAAKKSYNAHSYFFADLVGSVSKQMC